MGANVFVAHYLDARTVGLARFVLITYLIPDSFTVAGTTGVRLDAS